MKTIWLGTSGSSFLAVLTVVRAAQHAPVEAVLASGLAAITFALLTLVICQIDRL